MGLIVSRLERKTGHLDEFLFLVMNTMGNFVGNYIQISDISQFFTTPEIVERCEANLLRHISTRKRAYRTERDNYQCNPRNCQCHACVARALCNVEAMQNSWICLEELLHDMCSDEKMKEEADFMIATLRDFYFAMQFDLKICCAHKDKRPVIRKFVDEVLIQPLHDLVEEGTPRRKKREPFNILQESRLSPQPETSKIKPSPRDDRPRKHRSKALLNPTPEGLMAKALQFKSPRNVPISAGDATRRIKSSTFQRRMQEEQEEEEDQSDYEEEGAAAREESSEFVVKIVRKGGVYMPTNLDDLPRDLRSVFKRLEYAAKMKPDVMPSTSKVPASPRPQKPQPPHVPKKPDPPYVVPPSPRKKIQEMPQEVQEAMEALQQMQCYGAAIKPSRAKISEPDPESIHLDDLIASATARKQKQPAENPFKMTQRRRGKPTSPEPSPRTKVTTPRITKSPEKSPRIYGSPDDDKVFQLEDLIKAKQPPAHKSHKPPTPIPMPRERRRKEKRHSPRAQYYREGSPERRYGHSDDEGRKGRYHHGEESGGS